MLFSRVISVSIGDNCSTWYSYTAICDLDGDTHPQTICIFNWIPPSVHQLMIFFFIFINSDLEFQFVRIYKFTVCDIVYLCVYANIYSGVWHDEVYVPWNWRIDNGRIFIAICRAYTDHHVYIYTWTQIVSGAPIQLSIFFFQNITGFFLNFSLI